VGELDKGFRGKIASVQLPKQTNYNDCGLFALAFVLAIANKKDPAKLRFNQSTMRDHFSRCIAMDKFTEFDSEYMDIGPVYSEHCFRKMNPIIKK
jgi:Ulp1 family protease